MISTTMKACQEYSSFVIDPSNRDVSDSHVDRLEDAITDVYLLDAYPIVTTTERVVVDGQHRLRLAKSLGIPFYYIAGDGVTIDDVSLANDNTERYRTEDIVHVYSRMGMEPYQYLDVFALKHKGLPMGYLAHLLSRQFTGGDFCAGRYCINRANHAKEVADKLLDIARYKKDVLGWPSYRRAFEILATSPLYDHERMLKRLERTSTRLVHCGRVDEVMALLTSEIYNYNLRSDRRVDLTVADQHRRPIPESITIENEMDAPKRGIVHSSAVHVFTETDLSKFSVHPSARPLRNINKLVKAIKLRNLLRFYPVIVDKNMVIYDGRRRFEAAKRLGVPIYYIVLQNVSMWMIARAGGLTKTWSLRDYLKHHAASGVPSYVRMAGLLNKYPFLATESLLSLGPNSEGNDAVRARFKRGQYDLDNVGMELISFFSGLPASIAKKVTIHRVISALYRRYCMPYFLKRSRLILMANEDTFMLDLDKKSVGMKLADLYNSGLADDKRIEYGEDRPAKNSVTKHDDQCHAQLRPGKISLSTALSPCN